MMDCQPGEECHMDEESIKKLDFAISLIVKRSDKALSIIEEPKEKRFEVIPVPSLHHLSAKVIFENIKGNFFTMRTENPFLHLPKMVVEDLLKLCVVPRRPDRPTGEEEQPMVKLLLQNPRIEDLDIVSLEGLGRDNCVDFIQLALDHCPRLQHVTGPCPILPLATKEDTEQLAERIVTQWPNLKSLNLVGFYVTDSAMKVIQEKLPQLEKLSLCINKEKFTSTGLDFLKKMENVNDLELVLDQYDDKQNQQHLMLVAIGACAALPKLQKLHLDIHSKSTVMYQHFAYWFAKKVGLKKKLILRYVDASDPLVKSFVWPPNLLVEELFFHDYKNMQQKHLQCLLSIPTGVSKLTISNPYGPEVIYKLLERFGANLKILRMVDIFSSWKIFNSAGLQIYKVMSLCPVLEHFSTSSLVPWVEGTQKKIKIGDFANIKSFEIEGESKSVTISEPFYNTLRMAFYGSKNYEILEVQNPTMLTAVKWGLMHRMCRMTNVRVFNAVAHSENEILAAASIGVLLMKRSPYLKRIELHGMTESDAPEGFLAMARALQVELAFDTDHIVALPKHNKIHCFSVSNIRKCGNEDYCLEGPWCKRFFSHAHEDNDKFFKWRLNRKYKEDGECPDQLMTIAN